jgi:hypothetical protein
VRRHAKASTVGSTSGRAKHLPLAALAMAVALLLAATPAAASKKHLFQETFGSAAQPSFGSPLSVAIDQSSGDVLVMDEGGTPSIKRFKPDGTPDNFSALGTNAIDGQGAGDETPEGGLGFAGAFQSQIAVDNSGGATDGNIYVTQGFPNLINVFSEDGEYLGQLTAANATSFTEACGVAVDSSGAVYVGDYSNGIHKFVPAANPPVNADHTATFTATSEPCTLAAGASATAGFLFPAQYFGPISKIDSATGAFEYTVSSDGHVTVAVNPANGNVFGANFFSIKEFDASGAGSATSPSAPIALNGEARGLAVRGSSGDIYVTRSGSSNVEVFDGALTTFPDVTTGSASAVAPSSATLNGSVNPDGEALSECVFEWGETTSYGNTAPCVPNPAGIGSGTSPVAVSADISGLDPNGVEYHFRLKAANANGAITGQDETLQTKGPVILDTWAEDVVITEAILKAEINPGGAATTYHFEYGTTEAYGEETPELNVGSDSSTHEVSSFLEELLPGTTYHYRVVATNADSTNEGPDRTIRTFRPFTPETDCPNQAFRYSAGASLPDCRAYEMVSPVDKNNGDLRGIGSERGFNRVKTTPTGEKLTYNSYRAFGDAEGAPFESQYIARRLAGEAWETHSINYARTDPLAGGLSQAWPEYMEFSDDLCQAWMVSLSDPPLSDAAVGGYFNVYRRHDRLCGSEGFAALAPIVTPSFAAPGHGLYFHGASADGSHAIFVYHQKLVPEGAEGHYQLYESPEPGAPPRLVCVLPNEEPHTGNCTAGSVHGSYPSEMWVNATGAISDDGERIFWTDNLDEGKLYVRIGGVETVPVSEDGEAAAGTTGSFFWGAAADGSRAIYTMGDVSPNFPSNSHLFAFDVDSEATEAIAEGVLGVMGMSEDARRVYFVSRKALDGAAVEGKPNAYFYDADTGGGTTTFIATLAEQDAGEGGPVSRYPYSRNSRVAPDGLHAAFESLAPLTGYDNEDVTNGFPRRQAYVYDAAKDELVCASCNPSGARDLQNIGALSSIPPYETGLHASRALSDDGSRLFFNSRSSLVPRDTNGRADVYQWEALGAGGCDETNSGFAPSAKGCIELISSGMSVVNSEFMEASPSGNDVFVRTLSGFVPQDYGLLDIYDARIGGGLPVPQTAPECVGDACQSIPAAPNDPTPASASFRGAGDPKPRKARRRCRARGRQAAKRSGKARHKQKARRCTRKNRRAGR